MTDYSRYAIYYLPPSGPLADFGAAWLGWDAQTGLPCPHPDVPGVVDMTATPRKYGFHGTLKPPFRLADGCTQATLQDAVADLAATTAPATCEGLALTRLGRFLALTPTGDTTALGAVAAACVTQLDGFRAQPSQAELARRRAAYLSERQNTLLEDWGYPYVLDQFRFHLTLTGKLPKAQVAEAQELLQSLLPALPVPFEVRDICLLGEREDGCFELIHRYGLTG